MPRTTRRGFVQQSAALGLGLTAGLCGKAFAALRLKNAVFRRVSCATSCWNMLLAR